MVRGVLIAFGIMLLLAPVPLAQALGPFVGGYVGISWARSGSGYAMKGLRFGTLLGLLALLVSAAVAVALMLTVHPNLALLWLAVGAFTLYTGNMSALGAMYRLLRSGQQFTPIPSASSGQALTFPLQGGRDAGEGLS